jgi:ferritin
MEVKSLLSANMKKWLQKSIESELYASNFYKHLANQLQRLGYFGSQAFYLNESADELKHYQIIVEFMNDMGDVAEIPKVDAIKDKLTSIGDSLELAYEIEFDLYEQYKEFYKIAEDEDCAVGQFLLQFIEIQRLAIGEYGDLISKYKVAEQTKEILLFDKAMGKN